MNDRFPSNEMKVYEHHINCIYKCGMLLDEHVQLLHEFWRLPKIDRKEISWTVTSLPLLCGGFFTFKMKSLFPIILTSLPLAAKALERLVRSFKYKRYMTSFENLTGTLRNIFDFNKTIQKYYESRRSAISKLETSARVLIEEPLIYKLSIFTNNVFAIMENIIVHIQNQLSSMNNTIPSEFVHIFNLNLNGNITRFKEEDLASHFETVQMCFVLATSTFLSGLGLVLCNNPEYVLTEIVPASETFIITNFHNMTNMFENVTYSIPESEISRRERFVRIDSQVTISRLIESLQLTFYATLALQQCISEGNEDEVRAQLKDLEKLFGNSSNLLLLLQYEYKDKTAVYNAQTNPTEKTNNSLISDEKIIRYDDIVECDDEQEFSLSIHGSDTELEMTDGDTNLEYEQLREQVRMQKIIIKELNDELLRRKLIKEELVDENKVRNETKPESPTTGNDLFLSDKFSFNMDFLTQIRTVAQNRGMTESVFGDDIESDTNESSTE